MATMMQRLIDFDFQEVKRTQDYRLLTKQINGNDDRFDTVLQWYSDEPKKVYITMYKISGAVTISEADVLANHNELHCGVLENWIKFKEAFPEIKSAN